MHTYAHRGMEPKETFIPLGWSSCLYITMYCIFGVITFKGLLSIPCDGRGARRPQGQPFHESVGPANVKLWGGTPHTMASQSRKVRRERHMRREPATISSCNGRQSSNSSNSQRILPKAIPQTNILFRRC